MSQKPIIYTDELSPPARFVMITAALNNIDVETKNVELFKNENKTEVFTKINPLQKVPVLAVGNTAILDSHAAGIYLCERTRNEDLYPSDPLLRAKINELMFYECGTVFRWDCEIISSYFAGKWPVPDSTIEQWNRALDYLDTKLAKNTWLLGDKMYLCDVCIMSTVASMDQLFPLTDRHKNVLRWFKQFDKLPACYEITKRGTEKLRPYFDLFKPQK